MEERVQVLMAHINATALMDGPERSVKMKLRPATVIHVKMAAFASLKATSTNVSVQQNGLALIVMKCTTRAAKIRALMVELAEKKVHHTRVSALQDGLVANAISGNAKKVLA